MLSCDLDCAALAAKAEPTIAVITTAARIALRLRHQCVLLLGTTPPLEKSMGEAKVWVTPPPCRPRTTAARSARPAASRRRAPARGARSVRSTRDLRRDQDRCGPAESSSTVDR